MNECFGGFFSPLEILSAFLLQEKSMSFDLISVFYYVRAFKIPKRNLFIFKTFKLERKCLFEISTAFALLCMIQDEIVLREKEQYVFAASAPSIFAPWAL